MDLAVAGFRDRNVAASVADKVAVVDSGCEWAKVVVADTAWKEIAVADNPREELGVADNWGKEVAVADFVEDNLVPRTGTELAGHDQVGVIRSGEAGCIGAHSAEVDAQAVEYV